MIAVDANVLVYAHREETHHHHVALRWLHTLSEGSELWGLPVFCIGEFIRVVTHPTLFHPPSTLGQTLTAMHGLLESPSMRVLSPGREYPALFMEVVREADARANLVFDAQIAAVCKEAGCRRLLTFDRDFARFTGIRVVTPTESFGD